MLCVEVEHTAYQHHGRCQQNPYLEQTSHHDFHLRVTKSHYLRFICWRFTHSLFIAPFTIISTPRARMTQVKMLRSRDTFAFAR